MDSIGIITRMDSLSKGRVKICIDEFAFVLYRSELNLYSLKEGMELKTAVYEEIVETILKKRAKKRAMNLLQKKSYTRWQLEQKLKEGFYPKDVIETAITYVESYHYIDDFAYAMEYAEYHKEGKSWKNIQEALRQKGIDVKVLQQVEVELFPEGTQELEYQLAMELLRKKQYFETDCDYAQKQKLFGYLMRKGISSDVIRRALDCTLEME